MADASSPEVSREALISALTQEDTLFKAILNLVGAPSDPAGRRVSSAQRGDVLNQMHTLQLVYKQAVEFYWRQLPKGWQKSWQGSGKKSPHVASKAVKPFEGLSEDMQAKKELREDLQKHMDRKLTPGMAIHGTTQAIEVRHGCTYTYGSLSTLAEFAKRWNTPSNWMKCPDLGYRKKATGTRVDTNDGSHSEQTGTGAGPAKSKSAGGQTNKGEGPDRKGGFAIPCKTMSGGPSVATPGRHWGLGSARPPTKPTGTDYRQGVSTNINSGRVQGQGRFVAGATGGHAGGISKGVQIPAARPQIPAAPVAGRQGPGLARSATPGPSVAPGPPPRRPQSAHDLAERWKAHVANSKRGQQGTHMSKSQAEHVIEANVASLRKWRLPPSPAVAGGLASRTRPSPTPATPATRQPHPVPVRVR